MNIFHPLYKTKYKLDKLIINFCWKYFPFLVKKNRKEIIIRRNKEFISIDSYLVAQCLLISPYQKTLYCSPKIDFSSLGKYIKAKLDESKEISPYKMAELFNNHKIEHYFRNNDFSYLNRKITLQNRKELYRNMNILIVSVLNNIIRIYPCHQTNLEEFKDIRVNNKDLYFEYPINIKDEDLGKAAIDCFSYCTSIYSHYLK